ncbi:MAG: hypothetical protein QM697_04730 [Lachnospiraceae bacterium]
MTNLLVIKEQLIKIYARFEVYITPVLKFLTMLLTLIIINSSVGFMNKLKNPAIVLIVALLSSFLPLNVMILLAALFIVLHMYALSLECAIVVGLVLLLMFVLYFRFTPKDSIAVLLTPLCFALKIPYVVPLSMGFVGGPLSCISVSCGVVVYYILNYVKNNSEQLSGSDEAENAMSGFKYVIDSLIKNETMILMVVAFSVTVVLVYMIKRLSMNYSWRLALGAGAIVNLLIVLIGSLSMDADISVVGAVFGMLVSVLFVLILQFFIFNVDYSRTEYVQFEDDEYYYYVKAIPKLSLEVPQVKVKRINPQKNPTRD